MQPRSRQHGLRSRDCGLLGSGMRLRRGIARVEIDITAFEILPMIDAGAELVAHRHTKGAARTTDGIVAGQNQSAYEIRLAGSRSARGGVDHAVLESLH